MTAATSLALLNIAPGQVVQTDLDLEAFLEADPEEPPYLEYEGDGLVRRKMSPTTDHGAIAAHLCGLFDHWQRQTGRRLYVYVELRTISGSFARLPDVSVYRSRPPGSERKHALRVADLSIEIRSPRESLLQQHAKCRWYLEQGSQAALLLDPDTEIAEYFGPAGAWEAYVGTRVLPLEDILPGLDLTPQAIFTILHQP
jgi:Uma2 family endonuclease